MNKSKLQQIATDMQNLDLAFRALSQTMASGPSSYYFEKIMGYYEGCMKAAKFKPGDRVTLKEDWNGDASGWAHCKHFLKQNEPAIVYAVDYHKGKYIYEIEFDNETWIDSKGEKKPVSSKHTFSFQQKALKQYE